MKPTRRSNGTVCRGAAWLFALCFATGALATTEPAPTASPSQGFNAPAHLDKPVVIMLSLDGYRWDYPDLYPTPNIQRLLDSGVRGERLLPVFPTLTFPNHYTLVTGLAPAGHGIVGNEFPDGERRYALRDRNAVEDGSYYQGAPLWNLAEFQGMVAACFFWVGSEAPIQGVRPTHWRIYDGDIPNEERVDQVLAWAAEAPETRPRLITLYFDDVDSWSHYRGVGSPEFLEAMFRVDQALGRLLAGIEALPHADEVYLLLVSDHGQTGYYDEPPFVLADHVSLDGLSIVDQGPAVYAWLDGAEPAAAEAIVATVNDAWNRGRAYTRETAPTAWGLGDSPRHPDVVFQADEGFAVLSRRGEERAMSRGDHGWAPEVEAMHGVFLARGPGIAPGQTIGPVDSRSVYALVAGWLGLEIPATVTFTAPHLPAAAPP
jgi:predicted AlkP superfamily pyrophosphatase or phosphodiesterase